MKTGKAIVSGLRMMDNAVPLESIDADDLSPQRFRQFVTRNLPCVVRGGAAHWPALQRWSRPDYLSERTGSQTVNTYPHVNYQTVERHSIGKKNMPFADAWARASSGAEETVAVAWPISNASTFPAPECVYENLRDDIPGFAFLREPPEPLYYPKWRGFLYNGAGTGWHYHCTDCTLMSQVKGRKLVGLLPPDRRTYKAVAGPFLSDAYFDDSSCVDGVEGLSPLVATLEQGDSLFIPPYWWHGVEASEGFGITVAFCWRPPLHVIGDLSLPAIRKLTNVAVKSWRKPIYRKILGFTAAGAVAAAGRKALNVVARPDRD